jgi:hypothetical protein
MDSILRVVGKCTEPEYRKIDSSKVDELLTSIITDGVDIIVKVALTKPKPFGAHLQQIERDGGHSHFLQSLMPYIARKLDIPDEEEDSKTLLAECIRIMAAFYPEYLANKSVEGENLLHIISGKNASARAQQRGVASETCDLCHAKPALGTKLQRCSSCKVARYCSRDCQMKAWRSGHRKACRKEKTAENS